MFTLPPDFVPILMVFAPLFTRPVFEHVQLLVVGAILAPGKRTVTSALRAVGLDQEPQFQKYHRVLNRAKWSSFEAAHILLDLLIPAFAPSGPLVFSGDDTIERRWGPKIKARGIYRDAVRSTKDFVVKTSGLRWVNLMLLVRVPWSKRVWALPFFTVLAPSERYHKERNVRHKTSVQWMTQMIKCVSRWLQERDLVFVMDGGYAALELLSGANRLKKPPIIVTPLRMDAALYGWPPSEEVRLKGKTGKHRSGRKPVKGQRLPTLARILAEPELLQDRKFLDDLSIEWPKGWRTVTIRSWYNQGPRIVELLTGTALWYHDAKRLVPIRWVIVRPPENCKEKDKFCIRALLCTNLQASPEQILQWYLMRWQGEVTYEEVRAHLGVETQRQWSDKAIARTTPALFGLYSIVTLFAKALQERYPLHIGDSAWYHKKEPTFSDILAAVRRPLYQEVYSWTSVSSNNSGNNCDEISVVFERLTNMLCHAA